jgi:hypothetical protein
MTINVQHNKKEKVQTPYGCLSHNDEYEVKVVKEVSERLKKIKTLPDIEIIKWIIETCETLWIPNEYDDHGKKLICRDNSTQNYYVVDYIRRFICDKDDAVEDLLFSLRSWEDSI